MKKTPSEILDIVSGLEPGPDASLADHVFESLLRLIRSGELEFGSRLPSEMFLATKFQVSRPVVRSALGRLRDVGLVVSRKGAGSFVSSGGSIAGGGYAPLSSISDINSFLDFRQLIEAQTVALAASHPDVEKLAQLRELHDRMEREKDSDIATAELDQEFHLLIAEMSGNRFLCESLMMLRQHIYFLGKFVQGLRRVDFDEGKERMRREHLNIIEAMDAGDGDGARAAMIDHLVSSRRRVFDGV